MKFRLLLVDDTESVRLSLKLILADFGYESFLAADGATALALANAHELHGAIVDIHMPEMDGFRVCRALKAAHPALPVWLMTAAANSSAIRRQARDAGALDVFPKPFDFPSLSSAIGTWLAPRTSPPN